MTILPDMPFGRHEPDVDKEKDILIRTLQEIIFPESVPEDVMHLNSPPVIKGGVSKGADYPGGDGGGWPGKVVDIVIRIGSLVGSVYLAKKLIDRIKPSVSTQVVYINDRNNTNESSQSQPDLTPYVDNLNINAKLNMILDTAQDELYKAMEANQKAAQGNGNVMRSIAEQASNLPKTQDSRSSYKASEIYNPPSGGAFPNPLDPLITGAGRPFIEEDKAWIQRNLSYAKRPPTDAELAGMQAENQRLADAERRQQTIAHQQLKTLREQEHLARAQRLAIQRQILSSDKQNKTYLNQRQKILNQLFENDFFSKTEMDYPYEIDKNGKLYLDPNIARGIAIADWILNGQHAGIRTASWTDKDLSDLKKRIFNLTDKEQRQFKLAGQLHKILKANEELGSKRDDARAFANSIDAVIKANTKQGIIDEQQFIEDMRFLFIDQSYDAIGIPIKLYSGIKESNAAYNLGGGPRLGSFGWNKKYWDNGRLFDKHGHPINQAHHFTAFFTEALKTQDSDALRTWALNTYAKVDTNPQDKALADLAIYMANIIKYKDISWEILPERIYNEIKP